MKKLLFLTSELPFPAQSGGKIKSLKLLQALSAHYEVTLGCPLKLDDTLHLADFHDISPCVDHHHERIHVPRNICNLARSYIQRVPLNVLRTFHGGLRHRVKNIADDHDIVLLDHYEGFPYLPKNYQGLSIYHAHNAYFKMWERYAELSPQPALRLAALMEANRVRKYETAVANAVDMVFAAPNDAEQLICSGVPASKLHDTYHLGDDSQLELPELQYKETQLRLMYVGFLNWEPNSQGLLWFIEQVWPQLLSRNPNLQFDIVGKNPDERLRNAAARYPGIHLRGYVEDLQTIYKVSRVSVAPLLFGSGMKVKVMDAMARGMPTVTTTVGAEGIAMEPGEHLLVADSPEAMTDQIDQLLHDPKLWQRLQKNSRALIRERYTWKRLFDQMHSNIEESFSAKTVTSPGQHWGNLQHAG